MSQNYSKRILALLLAVLLGASDTVPARSLAEISQSRELRACIAPIITDANMAIWMIRHQLKNAAVAFLIGSAEQIGWAFSKQDKALQAAAKRFFAEHKASQAATLNRIWETHFGVSLMRFETLVRAFR